MKVSIVIPVYNEIGTLAKILEQVEQSPLPDFLMREIILVDDHSTDGTRELLEELQEKRLGGDLKVCFHPVNRGKGSALKTGFGLCTGDIVIIQDADLEYDPNEYPKLLEPILLGKADVVYGSRFSGGEPHRVLYFWHCVANRILTLMSNIFCDLNLTDMETCYKVFRKSVLDKITIEEQRFGIEPELTAKLARLAKEENLAVYEVGISYNGRTYSEGKKIGLKDAFRACWCIYKYNATPFANLIKYGANGVLVALSQFLTIIALVELAHFDTFLLKNIAFSISIEVSTIIGFFLHAFITWRYRFRSAADFMKRLLMFHVVTAVSFVIRQGLFYFLLKAGVSYRVNTLLCIAVAIVINFIGYTRVVFVENTAERRTRLAPTWSPPGNDRYS